MGTGVALLIGGGALIAVLMINRKSETATAMKAAQITNQKNSAGLGFGDLVTIGAVAAATYAGGPKGGAAAFQLSGARL